MRRAAVVLLVAMLLAACNRTPIDYAKEVRVPDDRGKVTQIDVESIQLDDKRTHEIDPEVQSFSTYNGTVLPIRSWKDKYVHIGLNKDGDVIWIAGIGVVDSTANPPVVRYTNGLLKKVEGRRAIFADGTVLQVDKSVKIPPVNFRLTANIDPKRHLVVDLRGTAQ